MPARPARRLAQLAVGAGLLLSAAACQQPSPGVTVVSGGHSVHVAASNYCGDGKTLTSQAQCVAEGPRVTTVKVRPGDTVGIDVDSELADTGWVLYDPVSKQNGEVHTDHYLSFTADLGDSPAAFLEVHQVTGGRSATDLVKVLGIWRFQLVER